jgi:hypothetical protein
VSLTKAGVRTFQQAFDAGQVVRDQMAESLSAGETRTLVSLLQRMTESLKERVTELATVSENTQ